jgi:hypothetical protein
MAGGLNLKLAFRFMETTNEPLHLLLDKRLLSNRRSWIYLQVLFESLLSLTELSNFWVYFGINAAQLWVEFCNCVHCYIFENYSFVIVIVKFDTTVFDWYDNGIILKPQVHCMAFLIKGIFNIRYINTATEKYSGLYINRFIFTIYNMG